MTGVVLKLLKATAPVSRSTRVNVVGWIATTCTCAIWSCGMVNSSALSELLGLFESAGAADLEPSQPANTKRIASAPTSAGIHRRRACIFMLNLNDFSLTAVHSRQFPHGTFLMASSWFLPLPSTVRARSYMRPTPVDRPAARNDNCARNPNNPAGWRLLAYTRIR